MRDELRTVIANWLRQAGGAGHLPDGIKTEDWVADQVMDWIEKSLLGEAVDELERAEVSVEGAHEELMRLGGWERFGEALHELTHAQEAVAFVRTALVRETTAAREPDHVLTILAVRDLERATAFYDASFGWPRRVDAPVYVEYELPGGRGLGIYERGGFARNTGQLPSPVAEGEITGTELYLRCEDLEGTMRRLEASGARSLSELVPRDWGDDAAYYADPDGNVVVVARRSEGTT